MDIALVTIGLVLMLSGMVLFLRGMWLRKPDHPSLEGPCGHLGWELMIRPWRYKNSWERNGYKYDLWGRITFTAGIMTTLMRHVF